MSRSIDPAIRQRSLEANLVRISLFVLRANKVGSNARRRGHPCAPLAECMAIGGINVECRRNFIADVDPARDRLVGKLLQIGRNDFAQRQNHLRGIACDGVRAERETELRRLVGLHDRIADPAFDLQRT